MSRFRLLTDSQHQQDRAKRFQHMWPKMSLRQRQQAMREIPEVIQLAKLELLVPPPPKKDNP